MPIRCAVYFRDLQGVDKMKNEEKKQGKPREWREASKQKRNPQF